MGCPKSSQRASNKYLRLLEFSLRSDLPIGNTQPKAHCRRSRHETSMPGACRATVRRQLANVEWGPRLSADRAGIWWLFRPHAGDPRLGPAIQAGSRSLTNPLCYASKTSLFWCRRGDSNSHDFRRYHLKVVRLPIPPRRQGARILAIRFAFVSNPIAARWGYRFRRQVRLRIPTGLRVRPRTPAPGAAPQGCLPGSRYCP